MDYNSYLQHHGIKGMRWGVRRYQNRDGSLTPSGKKRYDQDVRENNAKKKDNRIIIDGPDPKRWAKEDTKRVKGVVDSSSSMVKELQNIERSSRSNSRKRMNLSEMSDKEMRDQINRELLERQYSDMFSPKRTGRGREYVSKSLETAGTILAVGSSALGIALAIKELRG